MSVKRPWQARDRLSLCRRPRKELLEPRPRCRRRCRRRRTVIVSPEIRAGGRLECGRLRSRPPSTLTVHIAGSVDHECRQNPNRGQNTADVDLAIHCASVQSPRPGCAPSVRCGPHQRWNVASSARDGRKPLYAAAGAPGFLDIAEKLASASSVGTSRKTGRSAVERQRTAAVRVGSPRTNRQRAPSDMPSSRAACSMPAASHDRAEIIHAHVDPGQLGNAV